MSFVLFRTTPKQELRSTGVLFVHIVIIVAVVVVHRLIILFP